MKFIAFWPCRVSLKIILLTLYLSNVFSASSSFLAVGVCMYLYKGNENISFNECRRLSWLAFIAWIRSESGPASIVPNRVSATDMAAAGNQEKLLTGFILI